MARRSQCSDAGDNPLDPNYLPPHYREDYRLAVDALVEEDVEGYYKFLQSADVVDFLSPSEIDYIQNTVQLPKSHAPDPRSHASDPRYLDTGGDGSSDTYWPLHSDLDAPGLDLGWPQIHHFIGPTEVTTLVNPAAPDMPSIKEQARRLIKNAQMVIAVVMDMFTDVDIFADILNAAMRNVAVYLLLDEANVGHFVNMVNNCRVNLQSIQFLRVRTVSGIRYHCRSGKSFKGQMLDRFILTDCRAVLSGNYSFMWSYEKLHRCMAHLFLGQLVSTFDEEFRILFAQSEPLVIENMENVGIIPKHGVVPGPGDRNVMRDTRKYLNMGMEEESGDWRMAPGLKRHETFKGPADIYNRYPTPQIRHEPQFDPGPNRMMDSLVQKRHSFAEGAAGVGGRYNLPYQQQQQQALADLDQPGRGFYRGQHLHPRDEPDYGGYGQMDKFWNQDFHQEDPGGSPAPFPGYSREMEQHEGYDAVMNYLSSTRHLDVDQSSDKLIPGADLPYSTTHPRRQNIGQPYACQTSPTPSNTTEKRFMAEHGSDRKDPTVKKGLRNWRISSYLSAYDSSGEPEGLPMAMGPAMDPFDDMQHPAQQQTPPPAAIDLAPPKIPNVREFKVPALPRASQMPAFTKTTPRDPLKRFPDDITQQTPPLLFISEPKAVTPTPSESSSTTDGEKQEEPEVREPITSALRRDDSFRRKYNAAAVQRSSRLRSSLIFSSLDQNLNPESTEQEDDKTKADTETKLPFMSQVLAQRRSGTREPFEWRNYIKSTDNPKTEEDDSKPDGKQSESKAENVKQEEAKSEAVKAKDAVKSPELAPKVETALTKPSQIEQPKPEQAPPPTKPALMEPFVDMDDPDQRFLFFKELAAKRKAAKAAEEAKFKVVTAAKDEKKKVEQQREDEEKKKPDPKSLDLSSKTDKLESSDKKVPVKESSEKAEAKLATKDDNEPNKAGKAQKDERSTNINEDSQKTDAKTLDWKSKVVKHEPMPSPSSEHVQTKVTTDSEKIEAKQSKVSSSSTDKLTQDQSTLQGTDATKSAESQVNVVKEKEEMPPASSSDVSVKEPTLKTSRSVPDFAKSSVSDLLSSLPSARISERLSSQEVTPKSRLWSPSLHRRELHKPFGDKQKSVSTVGQTKEASKPQETTDVKAQETPASAAESKDSAAGKAQLLPTISENTQPQKEGTQEKPASTGTEGKKDGKETSSLQSLASQAKSHLLPSTSAKAQPQEKGVLDKSASGSTEVLKDGALTTQNQDALVKSNVFEVKEDEKQSLSRATAAVEMTKPELKQPIKEKCSDLQEKSNEKPKEMAEKAQSVPKPDELTSVIEKSNVETKPGGVASDKSSEMIKDSSVSPLDSKDMEKPFKPVQEALITPIDEARLKLPTEDVPQLESHSNTSSPASFATALEFIDSDMLSPAKNDPQHLFKLGKSESSTSDMSDFETPRSDLSMSPMPFVANMDDTLEDNVSIAETVIETASRRKSEKTEGREMDGTTQPSQKESGQTQLLEEDLSVGNLDTVISEGATSNKTLGSVLETLEDSAKTVDGGEDKYDVKNAQSERSLTEKESLVCPTASKVEQEAKVDKNVMEINTEGSEKGKSDHKEESTMSTSNVRLNKEKESPAAAGESKDPKQELLNKDVSKSIEPGKEVVDMKKTDSKVSPITKEEENKPLSNHSKPALVADITKEEKSTVPDTSKLKTKARAASSRFLSEPQASVMSQTSADAPKVTNEVEMGDKTAEIKEESQSAQETRKETAKETGKAASETKGQASEDSRPEINTKMVDQAAEIKEKSQCADETRIESAKDSKGQNVESSESKFGAKTFEQTAEIKTKEPSAAAESVTSGKAEAKPEISQVLDSADQDKPSSASPAKQESEIVTTASEISDKDVNESSKKSETQMESEAKQLSTTPANQNTEITTTASEISDKDVNELSEKSETEVISEDMQSTISPATSEDMKVLEKESKVTKEASEDGQSKDSEPVKTTESAPSGGQPKPQQQKPSPSRYMSSTANVISCSNLRDDTKILLEQISAQSQSRSETAATDDEKEDHAEKHAKRRKQNQLRDNNKSSQERDKVLERIQTMRKDRKVYSRFEL